VPGASLKGTTAVSPLTTPRTVSDSFQSYEFQHGMGGQASVSTSPKLGALSLCTLWSSLCAPSRFCSRRTARMVRTYYLEHLKAHTLMSLHTSYSNAGAIDKHDMNAYPGLGLGRNPSLSYIEQNAFPSPSRVASGGSPPSALPFLRIHSMSPDLLQTSLPVYLSLLPLSVPLCFSLCVSLASERGLSVSVPM